MKCSHCGAEGQNGSFCGSCGQPLAQTPAGTGNNTGNDGKQPTSSKKRRFDLRRFWPALAAIVLVIAVICALLISGILPTNNLTSFKRQVSRGDYEKAVEIYEKGIRGDRAKEAECADWMNGLLTDELKAFASGEKTGEEYEETLQTVQEVNDRLGILYGSDISGDAYRTICASKEAYQEGLAYDANGDAVAAIRSFRYVVQEDTENYEQAQAKIEEIIAACEDSAIETAAKLVADGRYEDALETVWEAEETVGRTEKLQGYYEEIIAACEDSAIETATRLAAEGQYEEALEIVQEAEETVGRTEELQEYYEKVVSDYQTAIIQMATERADAGSFDDAITLLTSARSVVGWSEALEEALGEIHTGKFQSILNAAEASGDYIAVIREYNNAMEDIYVTITPEMTSQYSNARTGYINALNSAAEAAFGSGKDYMAAIDVLKNGITEINDDDEDLLATIEAKIEEYKEYIPVPLSSLDYTQKASYINVGEGIFDESKDVNGTQYDRESLIYPIGGDLYGDWASSDDEAYVMYNLNYKYSSLSGIIYRPYRSLSSVNEWKNPTTVKIYGDDVLLYEAPNFTKDTYDTVEFALDVSGVRNLKIVMRGVWSEDAGWIGMYDYYPKVAMAEVFLQK